MAEGEIEVRILREKVIETSPGLGRTARTTALTFQAPGLPPLTVWVPEDQDTPETRSSMIRSKIQEFTAAPTRTLKV